MPVIVDVERTNFDKSLDLLLKDEGGFSNDPNDEGGPTNYGITLETFKSYRSDLGLPEPTIKDLKSIRPDTVKDIYRTRYWNLMGGQEINDFNVMYPLFNLGVNIGPKRAIRMLQKAVGTTPDGVVGPETLSAINQMISNNQGSVLATSLVSQAENFYQEKVQEDPQKLVYLNGWLNRTSNIAKQVGIISNDSYLLKNRRENDGTLGTAKAILPPVNIEKEVNFIDNYTILENGQFRFNDQILNIPPEQISIHIDEYENSMSLMRQETPVAAQSGKKRIRIIVNFPVDISSGWSQLAKIVTQIKKTPIATIENEKIRKELFGELNQVANIGVIVDNLTGYVEEEYPTLIRCTLQMSWFNHMPYVQELHYLEDFEDNIVKKQIMPSSKFINFYMEGTSNSSRIMNNDPSLIKNSESLVILYKEYAEKSEAVTVMNMDERSQLASSLKTVNQKAYEYQRQLVSEGWYLAEEDQSKIGYSTEGIFYRWRKFEIPFTDIDSSGALILQNMSFSLSTNPTYINMEKYSVPTVQFLGGSSSDIRAMVFAAGEHATLSDKTPVATSDRLAELQAIIKRVAENRVRYSKYNKENHLLISHPISKLLKYKMFGNPNVRYCYVEGDKETVDFNIDDFLPVIVSSLNSSTIPGLPYASRLQLDFKETRLAANTNNLKYDSISGSSNRKNDLLIIKDILNIFWNNSGIYFDQKKEMFQRAMLTPLISSATSPEGSKADALVSVLNTLREFDKKVVSLDTAFHSPYYKKNEKAITHKPDSVQAKIGEDGQIYSYVQTGPVPTEIFRPDWLEQFILSLYIEYSKGLSNGEAWVEPYITSFEAYSKIDSKRYKNLYPDMMLPDEEADPSFYFADDSKSVEYYRKNILRNMPGNYKAIQDQISSQLIKGFDSKKKIGEELQISSITGFAPSYNYAATKKGQGKGAKRVHAHNDSNFRVLATQQAISDASPPTHSLAQVYPTFQIQLLTPQYNMFQKLSSEDLTINNLKAEAQFDLLDVFDLSSILDIRIIKDQYEAADVMIIRVLNTYKTLMTQQGKDPTYNHKTFNALDLLKNIKDGKTTAAIINNNLEDIGIKEGVRIRAQLGNSNWVDDLSLEFQGRIAAVNGKDVIEIYCISDGHELIQNITGFKGEEKDREYTFNSETVDLIGDLLATTDEIKSFGNTKFEILPNLGISLPSLMGGVSALDNIYAPNLQPDLTLGSFVSDAASSALSTFGNIYGIGGVIGGVAATTAFFGGFGLVVGAAAIGGTLAAAYRAAIKELSPCKFTVYQQTIWDVLQELTLRHPGFICAIVPFDNRSTIYFGEPDGTYFQRGVQSAAEKAMKATAQKSGLFLPGRATQREIYDINNQTFKNNSQVTESSYQFLNTNAKTRQEALNNIFKSGNSQFELLSLAAMQKSFRSYHFITSENDIVSNDIEASAVDVANSVQVYYPTDDNEANFDGTTWLSNYALTDRMKADDDLHSNLINNKIFTFHNAHNEDSNIELPQRYAVSVLCKELENIYKGKITILGRKGIKPHDIVIINDTHNRISGPVKVGRVIQQVSPESGWVTHIYPKFIAVPNYSAGVYQLKNILTAARFWLGTKTEIFYSNMKKFIPDETNDSGKMMREIIEAYEMGLDSPVYYSEDEILKGALEREGEYALEGNMGNIAAGAANAAVFAGGQIGGKKLMGFTPNATKGLDHMKDKSRFLRYGAIQGNRIRKEGKKIIETGKLAIDAKKATGVGKVGLQTVKSSWKIGKIGLKSLFATGVGFAGGFILESFIESKLEGMISYLKHRQPISIFPLTKEGKPWMAALNGYKENSVIEHLEEELTKGADKLGMTSYLVQKWYKEWTGDAPPNIGRGGIYKVTNIGTNGADGDTFKIDNNGKTEDIRIIGYDTGELKSFGGTQEGGKYEKMMGEIAKKTLENFVKENENQVEIIRHGSDLHGRTLAEVKINKVDVAEFMRSNYLAMNYQRSAPKDYSEELPPEKKNDPVAIAKAREAAWENLYNKHQALMATKDKDYLKSLKNLGKK